MYAVRAPPCKRAPARKERSFRYSFDDALQLMARHCVNHLPVVEEDGKLIGIVSRDVVARYASSAPLVEIAE